MVMPDLTPERLAELRRLHEAATPGPWKLWNGWGPVAGTEYMVVYRIGPEGDEWVGIIADYRYPPSADLYAKREDAELVAAARNALPELLDEIQRLKGVILRAAADLARLACGAEAEIGGYAEAIRAIARRLDEEVGPTAARRGHHDA